MESQARRPIAGREESHALQTAWHPYLASSLSISFDTTKRCMHSHSSPPAQGQTGSWEMPNSNLILWPFHKRQMRRMKGLSRVQSSHCVSLGLDQGSVSPLVLVQPTDRNVTENIIVALLWLKRSCGSSPQEDSKRTWFSQVVKAFPHSLVGNLH